MKVCVMEGLYDLLSRLSLSPLQKTEDVCEVFEDLKFRVTQEVPKVTALQSDANVSRSEEYSVIVEANRTIVDSVSETGPLQSDSSTSTLETGLDITGSPLRCPFDEELLQYTDDTLSSKRDGLFLSKSRIVPVDMQRARFIASKYNLCCGHWLKNNGSEKPFPFLPMWVMCDGNDFNKTLAIGCSWKKNKLCQTVVTYSGPIKHHSNLMKLEQVKKRHFLGLRGKRIDIEVNASYAVNDCSVLIPDEHDEILPSSVDLCCKWKNCHNILESPPLDAQCTVSIVGKPECHQSLTHSMFEDLERLQELTNLKDTFKTLYDPFSIDKALIAKIEALIEEAQRVPVAIGRRQADPEQSVMSQAERNISSYIGRREYDICDKLWNVLKDFKNMSDLVKCFELIFRAAKQKKLLMVHKRSTTITEVIAGKTDPPILNELVPLELLVEVGMDKLRRDCLHFFTASEMATKEQLKPYLEPEFSVANTIHCLRKLNYVIEVVMTAAMSLKLPDNVLRVYTKYILLYFIERDIGIFDYKIHPSIISTWIQGNPESWKITLTSTEENMMKRTVLLLSQSLPADWISTADPCASGFFETLFKEIVDNILG